MIVFEGERTNLMDLENPEPPDMASTSLGSVSSLGAVLAAPGALGCRRSVRQAR